MTKSEAQKLAVQAAAEIRRGANVETLIAGLLYAVAMDAELAERCRHKRETDALSEAFGVS